MGCCSAMSSSGTTNAGERPCNGKNVKDGFEESNDKLFQFSGYAIKISFIFNCNKSYTCSLGSEITN